MKNLTLFIVAVVAAFSQDATRERFNVRDFGRVAGDGTIDDSAAVNSCIGRARAIGGSCVFPPGDYRVTRTIRITANPISGNNADASVIGISGIGHSRARETRSGSRI